jgi:hypothetical protein
MKKLTSAKQPFSLSMARYYQGRKISLEYRNANGFKKVINISIDKIILQETKLAIKRTGLSIPAVKIYTIKNYPYIFFFKKGKILESRVIGFERNTTNDLYLIKQ